MASFMKAYSDSSSTESVFVTSDADDIDTRAKSDELDEHVDPCDAGLRCIASLAGLFAHDLSNPLQTVLMQLELLSEDLSPTNEATERFDAVIAASREFRSMLTDLAKFAHHQKRDDECHVKFAIRRIIDLMSPRLQRRQVDVRVDDTQCTQPFLGSTASLEFTLLTVLLATTARLRSSAHVGFRLSLTVQSEGDFAQPRSRRLIWLDFALAGLNAAGVAVEVLQLDKASLAKDLAPLTQRVHIQRTDRQSLLLRIGL